MKRHVTPLAIIAFAVAEAASPAQAGLLDFLFGGGRPQQQTTYIPIPQQNFDQGFPGRDSRRKPADAAKAAANDHRTADQAARDLAASRKLAEVARDYGPKAAFMQDPTLRHGDIVVMPSGIEVFEGSGGGKIHAANQFRPLSRSAYRNRSDLALLQAASGLNAAPQAAPDLPTAAARPLTIPGKRAQKPKAVSIKRTADASDALAR